MKTGYLASVAAVAALTLSGCREVGPNYKTPAMPAPPPPAYSDSGHNGDWQSAQPRDAADRGAWWTIYQDALLNDYEDRCAKANQNIIAALHAYEQAHDMVLVNRANLYPTVAIGASGSRNKISNNLPTSAATTRKDYWNFLIPLDISWEPDLWGGIRRQVESSAANAQASAADLANTKLSLQGMLAVTYLQLRGIDLQAQILRQTIDTYTQTLELTQNRYKGGLATELDVQQAQAQLEEVRVELTDLGVQRAQYEHAIAVLAGESAIDFHVPEKPLAGDPPSIPTGLPSELLERRPDIAGAERRVASANAQIGVAKSAFYPSVTLGASGGVQSDLISKFFSAGSTMWNAGPSVNETLYDAGRRRAQLNIAIAQRDQATALYREQVLSAFRDVEDQLSALRVLEHEADDAQRAVVAARRSTDLSTIRYKGGVTTYLEVLTNQTIQLTDERTAASLVSRRIVASAQLQLALGGGWNVTQLPKN